MGSNSDDLVERLRARLEAADEIERLRAEVADRAVQLEQAEAKLAAFAKRQGDFSTRRQGPA